MKNLFSGDLETTGLNPLVQDILEIGFVCFQPGVEKKLDQLKDEGRVFHCYVSISDDDLSKGDPYALNLNKEIIRRIKDKDEGYLYLNKGEVIPALTEWANQFLEDGEKMNIAGKNFGAFDIQFIKQLPGYSYKLHTSRFIDPAVMFIDWEEDVYPPSLSECLQRAGMNETVTHTAVEDSFQVMELINYTINN